MTLKEITLIQRQLQKHKANHGQFTIEVARLELFSTETHVKLGDLLHSSGLGTNQQSSEEPLKDIARLEKLTFLAERPLQLAHRSGCLAPWPRLLEPGPTHNR